MVMPRVPFAINSGKMFRYLESCRKNSTVPACEKLDLVNCAVPTKGGHGAQADNNFYESVPALPACPLHQSFELIHTATPISTTSYLQENKPGEKIVQDIEQTSKKTKVSTLPRKPINPGIEGAQF